MVAFVKVKGMGIMHQKQAGQYYQSQLPALHFSWVGLVEGFVVMGVHSAVLQVLWGQQKCVLVGLGPKLA